MQAELQQYHFNLGQNLDVKDTANKWVNAEIIYIKDQNIYIHYSGWSAKYDQYISIHSERLLAQWDHQQELRINNRVDAFHPFTGWLEARVIDRQQQFNQNSHQKQLKRVKVHYFNYHSKYDRWIDPYNREEMDIIGSKSKAYGIGKSRSKRKGQTLTLSELSKKILQIKKRNMIQQLSKKSLIMKSVDGDGNCLFRSVSDQLYGTQEYHSQIRSICMNYIQKEKNFFQDYVTEDIESYIQRKMNNGVWGDDIEIQAISEIYCRPIEIYATSSKPLRTFHEDSSSQIEPLRLAYVGSCHYNSIKREDEAAKGILQSEFGKYEQLFMLGYDNRDNDQSIDKYRGFFSRTNGIQDALFENVQAGENKEELNQKILEIQTKEIKEAINISQTENILEEIEKSEMRQISYREEQLLLQQELMKIEERQLEIAQELSKKSKPQRPYWFSDLIGLGFRQQEILFAIEINGYDAERVQNFLLDNM